jgi:hypothetical protein
MMKIWIFSLEIGEGLKEKYREMGSEEGGWGIDLK